MHFPVSVRLKNRATHQTVAGIIRPTDFHDMVRWFGWKYYKEDEDKSWNWMNIFFECLSSKERHECLSLLVEDTLHGLMALDLEGCDGPNERGLVVDHLATNPLNRGKDSHGTSLKHVGASLLTIAVVRSMECGMNGAIWLESFSGARMFYEGLGFQKQPGISEEGNSIYFLDSTTAKEMLGFIKRNKMVSL